MPIRPENRGRYPKDWKAISNRIRFERAEGRCECTGECGAVEHDGRCDALHATRHPITDSIVVLTVAHLNHIPEDCADDNLKSMCQRCHNRYDMPMRRAGIARRKREALAMQELPL
jgi:hypothetical protein